MHVFGADEPDDISRAGAAAAPGIPQVELIDHGEEGDIYCISLRLPD